MRNGTHPGILISDLMSGDGPHRSMAEHFLKRRCEVCDSTTTGQLVIHGDRWHCADCVSAQVGLLVSS